MTCKEKVLASLEGLPPSWAEKLATVICDTIQRDIACEDVVACETLTTLSTFTTTGTQVCVTYTGEDGTPHQRCFDFDTLMGSVFNGIDPKCLAADSTAWNALTFLEKWQAIIDKVCLDCP